MDPPHGHIAHIGGYVWFDLYLARYAVKEEVETYSLPGIKVL